MLEAVIVNISNRLDAVEIEIFNTPAYQKWTSDLFSLKSKDPKCFQKYFGKRKRGNLQDVIVNEILHYESKENT